MKVICSELFWVTSPTLLYWTLTPNKCSKKINTENINLRKMPLSTSLCIHSFIFTTEKLSKLCKFYLILTWSNHGHHLLFLNIHKYTLNVNCGNISLKLKADQTKWFSIIVQKTRQKNKNIISCEPILYCYPSYIFPDCKIRC